jgi:hypothetical protein
MCCWHQSLLWYTAGKSCFSFFYQNLSLAELWYNTSYHSSLQYKFFKALYAVDPHPGLCPTLQLIDHPDVAELLKERQVFTALFNE